MGTIQRLFSYAANQYKIIPVNELKTIPRFKDNEPTKIKVLSDTEIETFLKDLKPKTINTMLYFLLPPIPA